MIRDERDHERVTESPDASSGPADRRGDTPGEPSADGGAATEGRQPGGGQGFDRASGGAELDGLRGEIATLNDRHLRLAAEFENYRKRSQTMLGEAGVRAQATLVTRLLDVLDDFRRVTSLDPEVASVESLLEGVALVERKLLQHLVEAGLQELDPEDEAFDPNFMEAMARVPAESEEEDETVDKVFQRGFLFGGHLVRPARVSVRKLE